MIELINSIDPFVLAFLLGLVILLIFTRERLDAPIKSAAALSGVDISSDNPIRTTDAVFVHRLPPSSVRVARFFWVACAVYFLGLALILAVLCACVAAGLDNLVPDQGGLVQDQSAVPQVGRSNVQLTPYPILNSVLAYLDRESTISDYPWQPVLLALGLVGLLPSLPFIRSVEGRVRLIALRVAGIPSQVIKLWAALRDTPVPDQGDTLRQQIDTKLTRAVAAFRDFTGAGHNATNAFAENLTKVLYYNAWISDGTWPERSVRRLIKTEAPGDLDANLRYTLAEMDHLISLSAVVGTVSTETRHGFAERAAHFETNEAVVSDGDLDRARGVIKERWQELARKLEGSREKDVVGQADFCCLMVAVYSERSQVLRGAGAADDDFNALRAWIIQARQQIRRTSIPVNFALFIAATALIGVLIAHYICVEMSYISISDYSTSLRASTTFMVGVMTTLVAALLPVYWVREVLDDEAHWQSWVDIFRPPFLQYVAFALGALAIGTTLQFVFIFIDPRIEGVPSRIQLKDMISWGTVQSAMLMALPGTALATFLSLAHDQRERKNRVRMWSVILMALSIAFLFLALVFQPDYEVLAKAEAWTFGAGLDGAAKRAWSQGIMIILACVLLQIMIVVNLLRSRSKA